MVAALYMDGPSFFVKKVESFLCVSFNFKGFYEAINLIRLLFNKVRTCINSPFLYQTLH